MKIEKNIFKYVVFSEDSIINALQKISDNRMRFIFVVNESNIIEGILTDGDFRRWVVEQKEIDLNQKVENIANKDFVYCTVDDDAEKIQGMLSSLITCIPVVDKMGRLERIVFNESVSIAIGRYTIDKESPAFIIAEIGNNHNGSLELAKKLVDGAIKAGANCAKFQLRNLSTLYKNRGKHNDASEDLGSQYVLDLLNKFQLTEENFKNIFDYCKIRGILPLCTPWDKESVDFLEKYGIEAYKVASADLTNHELLTYISKKGKPILCSTGMATEREILDSVNLLKSLGAQFVLLHCNSTYPAPFKDINLKYMNKLAEIGNCPVGYSGHERGISIPIAAVSLGAKVIEKHITLDKSLEGNDHKVSLLPEEFKVMVEAIREVEQSLGSADPRLISQGELINREALAKSLVINCDLKKGEIIKEEMVEIKSPGKGLAPYHKKNLIGKPARRDFQQGDFFYLSDIAQKFVEPKQYHFSRPFGIPVRYHDFEKMKKASNFDLLEFHLSYKDLEEKLENFFKGEYELGLVVHCPELFAGDHILDLCTDDVSYRNQSIAELQKVIDITLKLGRHFPKTQRPCIVVNCGGFSMNDFISAEKKDVYYRNIEDSLKQLNMDGVELIPQTMPPFPWHFGGQRYHNLFLTHTEIEAFCKKNKMRVCLDVSHSKLACNYHKISFSEFIKTVGPYTAHLHMGDARGVDGEGLQIGEGEMDFALLAEELKKYAPRATFIPEIWQGHKNDGEGFWIALNKLEKSHL